MLKRGSDLIKSSKTFFLTHLRSVWTNTVVVYDLPEDSATASRSQQDTNWAQHQAPYGSVCSQPKVQTRSTTKPAVLQLLLYCQKNLNKVSMKDVTPNVQSKNNLLERASQDAHTKLSCKCILSPHTEIKRAASLIYILAQNLHPSWINGALLCCFLGRVNAFPTTPFGTSANHLKMSAPSWI